MDLEIKVSLCQLCFDQLPCITILEYYFPNDEIEMERLGIYKTVMQLLAHFC